LKLAAVFSLQNFMTSEIIPTAGNGKVNKNVAYFLMKVEGI
jgi:hypothetical protein